MAAASSWHNYYFFFLAAFFAGFFAAFFVAMKTPPPFEVKSVNHSLMYSRLCAMSKIFSGGVCRGEGIDATYSDAIEIKDCVSITSRSR